MPEQHCAMHDNLVEEFTRLRDNVNDTHDKVIAEVENIKSIRHRLESIGIRMDKAKEERSTTNGYIAKFGILLIGYLVSFSVYMYSADSRNSTDIKLIQKDIAQVKELLKTNGKGTKYGTK